MRDDFGLGCRALGLPQQDFCGVLVQRLPTALEQALVSRVLDQRMLETIGRLRRHALDEQEVGVGETLQRRTQGYVLDGCDL